MRSSKVAFAAAALSIAWCGSAWADEASEKALARKVEELQRQLDDLSKRMGDGANRSDDELEQRIAELEKITKKDQDGLFAYWKNGLKLDSADGSFKLSIFGRIQNDYTFWDSDQEVTDTLGETNSATEFRRARLGVSGQIYKNVIYKAEWDFAGGSANFTDMYMQLNDAFCGPGINVKVGHFDEPFLLDEVTSSKYMTFTERALPVALAPARNTGVEILGQAFENKVAYFLGAFRDANNFGNDTGNDNQGEHEITGRITGRPWISEDGAEWIHLGIAASARNPSNETVRYNARPEVHTGPEFVDTTSMTDVDKAFLTGLEAAGVFGSFAFSGEWVNSDLSGTDGAEDRTFTGGYVYASYFLTGEHRTYDAKEAKFDRINTVKKNYGPGGMGAWEIGLRYSTLDLNDGDIEGGQLDDWTLGLNWYLNPNTRVMFDIIRADREDLPSIYAFTVRFAIDF